MNEKKILDIVEKNNGYITLKELRNNEINPTFVSRMVKKGILEKYAKGYYGLSSYFPDEYFIMQAKSRYAIYSHSTALYLHNLSDRIPLYLDVTVPNNYGGVLQKEKTVKLHTSNKDIINLGVIEITSPFGMKVRVYDMERTICDIIRLKKKIDAEVFSKALKNYATRVDKNIFRLFKYSQQLNIEDKVRDYMEALL